MKIPNLFAILILSALGDVFSTEESDFQCGKGSSSSDWARYRDEKCYRILDDTLRTYEEAVSGCAQLDSGATLARIESQQAQRFVANYLFNVSQKVDNFWLGGRYSSESASFEWQDGVKFNYTNWDRRAPRNRSNYCVQMQADESVVGKWMDGPCERKHAVLCQKMQTWSLEQTRVSFSETRRALNELSESYHKKMIDLEGKIYAANLRINESNAKNSYLEGKIDAANLKIGESNIKVAEQKLQLEEKVSNLKQTLIPIGFVYTQLPNTPTPASLWPWISWTDVSATYAGVFFRVDGAGAAPFGEVQQENAREVVRAELTKDRSGIISEYIDLNVTTQNTKASKWIWTGDDAKESDHYMCLRFITTTGEIRPRNMAIRVWKRTA